MPSPFPGMDPYLENRDLWPDAHHRFISEPRWSNFNRNSIPAAIISASRTGSGWSDPIARSFPTWLCFGNYPGRRRSSRPAGR